MRIVGCCCCPASTVDQRFTVAACVSQGWKPEYHTNAIAISSPSGPWGSGDGAYWKMAPTEYAAGDAVDCTDFGHGCWQIPPE